MEDVGIQLEVTIQERDVEPMATQPQPAEQVQIPDQAESMPVDQVPVVADVGIASPVPPQPTPSSPTPSSSKNTDTSIGDRIYKRLMSDSSEIEEEVISVPTDTGSELVTLMDSADQSKLMDVVAVDLLPYPRSQTSGQ